MKSDRHALFIREFRHEQIPKQNAPLLVPKVPSLIGVDFQLFHAEGSYLKQLDLDQPNQQTLQ